MTRSNYRLESHQDTKEINGLKEFLISNVGNDIEINAADTDALSASQIELLLSGYCRWQKDGQQFNITGCQSDFLARLMNVGVPAQLFSEGH